QALNAEPVYVTVPLAFHQDGMVMLNDEKVRLEVLSVRVQQALYGRATKDVFVRGDGHVWYEDLVRVMDTLKVGGVEKVGLLTQPPKTDKQIKNSCRNRS